MSKREEAEPPQRPTTTSGGVHSPRADEGPTVIPPAEEAGRGRKTSERKPRGGHHAPVLPDKPRPPHE